MTTITKQTSTTTERGTLITLVITASRGWHKVTEHLYNDGWESDVEKMQVINDTTITAEVNGQKYTGEFRLFVPEELKKQGVFAIFAGKLAISERVYNDLNAVCEDARKEAEKDEEWIAYLAKVEEARKKEEEYEKNYKAIRNMMTMNGRSY